MLDMIGGIGGTAVYVTLVGVLVGLSAESRTMKLAAIVAAGAWGAGIVAAGALGGFAPGITGPVPAPVLAFAASLVLVFGSWLLSPRFRHALLAVPLPALVGLNAARLGGAAFLVLASDGRLPAPFAPVAGWGDIGVAALAIPLAIAAAGEPARHLGWLAVWNVLGAVDLVVAVSLGILSAPGTPFQLFAAGAGTTTMASLPWVIIPALLVPLFLLVHVAIAARLNALQRTMALAVAG
ncbi:MAG: hypothetical protein ACE147_04810 [Candidatus Methylomirabilales bacterium]